MENSLNFIRNGYIQRYSIYSDISEHIQTLYKYTLECDSVFETGVRGVVSSYAFAFALFNKPGARYFLNDIDKCNIEDLYDNCKEYMNVKYEWCNNLDIKFEPGETYDLTFIDTWHCYAQLTRELEKFSKLTNKYIIMHDTTVDEWDSESVRMRWNIKEQSIQTGFPEEEIRKGLWPAVEDFLTKNDDWVLHERFRNNNGLTKKQSI